MTVILRKVRNSFEIHSSIFVSIVAQNPNIIWLRWCMLRYYEGFVNFYRQILRRVMSKFYSAFELKLVIKILQTIQSQLFFWFIAYYPPYFSAYGY